MDTSQPDRRVLIPDNTACSTRYCFFRLCLLFCLRRQGGCQQGEHEQYEYVEAGTRSFYRIESVHRHLH